MASREMDSDGEQFSASEDDEGSDYGDSDSATTPGQRQGGKKPQAKEHKISNQPFDEAVELSGDLSMPPTSPKERRLKNDKYDEALDVSASMNDPHQVTPKSHQGPPKDAAGGGGVGAEAKKEKKAAPAVKATGPVSNKPFDEAFELSQSDSDESVPSDHESATGARKSISVPSTQMPAQAGMSSATSIGAQAGGMRGGAVGVSGGKSGSLGDRPTTGVQGPGAISSSMIAPAMGLGAVSPSSEARKPKGGGGDESESDDEHSDDDDEPTGPKIDGAYNPKDYAYLQVNQEIRDLFLYITRYKPHEVELDTHLKCFIPDYIPAVGEMDAFLKMSRPDGPPDELGLKVLDEPASSQSDATVLELQLRAISKKQHAGDVTVRSIENAAKCPGEIDRWIASINELHRSKPPPQVHYKRAMPDIEQLMDVWPEEFEDALGKVSLPSPDLGLTLEEYVKVVCAVLDIPVYEGSLTESLHVLFTLYMEFKNNQHFMAAAGAQNGMLGGHPDDGGTPIYANVAGLGTPDLSARRDTPSSSRSRFK